VGPLPLHPARLAAGFAHAPDDDTHHRRPPTSQGIPRRPGVNPVRGIASFPNTPRGPPPALVIDSGITDLTEYNEEVSAMSRITTKVKGYLSRPANPPRPEDYALVATYELFGSALTTSNIDAIVTYLNNTYFSKSNASSASKQSAGGTLKIAIRSRSTNFFSSRGRGGKFVFPMTGGSILLTGKPTNLKQLGFTATKLLDGRPDVLQNILLTPANPAVPSPADLMLIHDPDIANGLRGLNQHLVGPLTEAAADSYVDAKGVVRVAVDRDFQNLAAVQYHVGDSTGWIYVMHDSVGIECNHCANSNQGIKRFHPPGSKVILYDGTCMSCDQYTSDVQKSQHPVNALTTKLKTQLRDDRANGPPRWVVPGPHGDELGTGSLAPIYRVWLDEVGESKGQAVRAGDRTTWQAFAAPTDDSAVVIPLVAIVQAIREDLRHRKGPVQLPSRAEDLPKNAKRLFGQIYRYFVATIKLEFSTWKGTTTDGRYDQSTRYHSYDTRAKLAYPDVELPTRVNLDIEQLQSKVMYRELLELTAWLLTKEIAACAYEKGRDGTLMSDRDILSRVAATNPFTGQKVAPQRAPSQSRSRGGGDDGEDDGYQDAESRGAKKARAARPPPSGGRGGGSTQDGQPAHHAGGPIQGDTGLSPVTSASADLVDPDLAEGDPPTDGDVEMYSAGGDKPTPA
jgi:hypothetical protein